MLLFLGLQISEAARAFFALRIRKDFRFHEGRTCLGSSREEVVLPMKVELPIEDAPPMKVELPIEDAPPMKVELPIEDAPPMKVELPIEAELPATRLVPVSTSNTPWPTSTTSRTRITRERPSIFCANNANSGSKSRKREVTTMTRQIRRSRSSGRPRK